MQLAEERFKLGINERLFTPVRNSKLESTTQGLFLNQVERKRREVLNMAVDRRGIEAGTPRRRKINTSLEAISAFTGTTVDDCFTVLAEHKKSKHAEFVDTRSKLR